MPYNQFLKAKRYKNTEKQKDSLKKAFRTFREPREKRGGATLPLKLPLVYRTPKQTILDPTLRSSKIVCFSVWSIFSFIAPSFCTTTIYSV